MSWGGSFYLFNLGKAANLKKITFKSAAKREGVISVKIKSIFPEE